MYLVDCRQGGGDGWGRGGWETEGGWPACSGGGGHSKQTVGLAELVGMWRKRWGLVEVVETGGCRGEQERWWERRGRDRHAL